MDYQTNVALSVLIAAISGLLSGGLVVALVEIARLRRERRMWKEIDRKIDLQVISAESQEIRWNPSHEYREKERLRIYEKNLDGKIKIWMYLVKVSITNLTDHELLALSVGLNVPTPEIRMATESKGLKSIIHDAGKYDLLKKDPIRNVDLPLVLPAKSKIGVVFVGYYEFDFPQLVEKAPDIATFSTQLDDGSIHQMPVPLILVGGSISEVDWVYDDNGEASELLWIPFMDKYEISYGLPSVTIMVRQRRSVI